MTVVAGGQMKLEAAQQVHAHAREEKNSTGSYKRKLFTEHEFKTLGRLAELIVPADSVRAAPVMPGHLSSSTCWRARMKIWVPFLLVESPGWMRKCDTGTRSPFSMPRPTNKRRCWIY